MTNLNKFYFCLTIFASMMRGINAIIAYDCNVDGLNFTSISLIHSGECHKAKNSVIVEDVSVAVSQVSSFKEIPFISCSVEIFHHLWRCGSTIDTGYPKGLYTSNPEIFRDECLDMHTKNRYYTTTDNRIEIKLGTGIVHKASFVSRGYISNTGSCTEGHPFEMNSITYDKPVENSMITITRKKGNAKISLETGKLQLSSGVECRTSEETCFHPDYGYIFWKQPVPKCKNEGDNKALIYKGAAKKITSGNDHYIIVNHGGYDFQILLSNRRTYICGYSTLYTEHPRLFVTLLNNDVPAFPEIDTISPVDVNMLDYINSKIVYSVRHIKVQVEKLFEIMELERCNMKKSIIKNMLTSALTNPVNFAYDYYDGPGYTAVVKGEVVYVALCKAVSVTPNVDIKGCFNELPVSYNNRSMFVSPRNRILIPVGEEVDCVPDMLPKYFIDGSWIIKTDHGLMRTESPHRMQIEPVNYTFTSLTGMAQGGLYKDSTILKYQDLITSSITKDVVTNQLSSSIIGTTTMQEGYLITNSFKPYDFSRISTEVNNFWSKFKLKTLSLGNWFSVVMMFLFCFKLVLYCLSCALNFSVMYKSFGLCTAVMSFWWEALCNTLLHFKYKQRRTDDLEMQQSSTEDKRKEEGEVLLRMANQSHVNFVSETNN